MKDHYVHLFIMQKTPRISYDQHPLVAVTEVLNWGFKGINFHLRKHRQYTWPEIAGQVYIVQNEELDDLPCDSICKNDTK